MPKTASTPSKLRPPLSGREGRAEAEGGRRSASKAGERVCSRSSTELLENSVFASSERKARKASPPPWRCRQGQTNARERERASPAAARNIDAFKNGVVQIQPTPKPQPSNAAGGGSLALSRRPLSEGRRRLQPSLAFFAFDSPPLPTKKCLKNSVPGETPFTK